MTTHPSRCASLLLALTLPWAGPTLASPVSLYDNLSQDGDYMTAITNTEWAAQGFATTATAFTLTTVEAAIFSDTPSTGTFALEIWSPAGGAPGTKVAEVFSGNANQLTGSTFAVSGLNLALSAGTSYFLLIKGVSLDEFSNLQWRYADAAGGTGLPSAFAQTTDAGLNWSTASEETPQKMRIEAATEMPVPAVPALMAIGLAGLHLTRRRSVTSAKARRTAGRAPGGQARTTSMRRPWGSASPGSRRVNR